MSGKEHARYIHLIRRGALAASVMALAGWALSASAADRHAPSPPDVKPPQASPLTTPKAESVLLTLTAQRSGRLADLLLASGVQESQVFAAMGALGDFLRGDGLQPGDQLHLVFRRAGSSGDRLVALSITDTHGQIWTIVAGRDGMFESSSDVWRFATETVRGVVKGPFLDSLRAAGAPAAVAKEVVDAFALDPDLPARPATGAPFELVYETVTADSPDVPDALLRCATIRSDGGIHSVYRYPMIGGRVAFLEPDGKGVVPLSLGAPIKDAPITSPYGWRMHPVLHVRLFHKGVDFGAPAGTAIYAAQDGVVDEVGWRGNYGRYIRVKHSDRVSTAYAHMRRFASHLKVGTHVRRGQVIGYVGATGLATGPHLYFEVLIDHHQVNPESPDLVVPVALSGPSLERFETFVRHVTRTQTADARG
jgi:murein DD-endopeptidase MepM/ murein hydrolase activator NlpD